MPNRFSLKGKVALVTGSTRGLGYAMALALAEHGAKVVLNGRDGDAVKGAVGTLIDNGHQADGRSFDVNDAEASVQSVADIARENGTLDILVNNAGVQHREALCDWTDSDFENILSTNLTSCFRLAREASRVMVKAGYGRIINTGSITGILARPTVHGYVAAKAGLHGLTRSLASELGPNGVTVNALAPGFFSTELNTALHDDSEFSNWVKQRTPLRRWGDPDEISGAIVFLASDAASYVNGHVLTVDGGMSINL